MAENIAAVKVFENSFDKCENITNNHNQLQKNLAANCKQCAANFL